MTTDYKIKKAEIDEDGLVFHELENGERIKYSDVRGGLSWPTIRGPAYYCILGELYMEFKNPNNPYRRGKIHLLKERVFDGLSVERLCKELTDDNLLYAVSTFYCNLDDKYMEYYDAIIDYGYAWKTKTVMCEDAPFKENFQMGLAQVHDWRRDKLLELPGDSIAQLQTAKITQTMLSQPDCDLINYATNALRFAVSGFYRDRPRCYRKKSSWRNRNRSGKVV